MQASPIRFAVIGQGHIGKRHAEMIRRNPQAQLVCVCDVLPPEGTGTVGIKEAYYRSAATMLATEELDVVCVCVPNGLHTHMALMALDSGCHVVIEKPMALTTRDAERIIQRAIERERHVFCVMQNRYSPPSVWLKEVVQSGKLGHIYLVQLNCLWNRDARYYKADGWHGTKDMDGGTLFTQFSHFVDIMYWLFGDIDDIQANLKDFNHQELTDFEDSGIVTFRFKEHGDACGVLTFSTAVWDCNLESSLTIVAERGSVKVSGQYMNEVVYCHIADYEMPQLAPSNPPNDYGAYKGSAQNHHYVIQNVVDVLTKGADITTNAYDGLRVVNIIERIYASAGKTGG